MILLSTEKRFIPLVFWDLLGTESWIRGYGGGLEHPVRRVQKLRSVIKGYSLLRAEEAPSAFSSSLCALRAPPHWLRGATERPGKRLLPVRRVPPRERQMTGNGACAGLLLSNGDARPPGRCGSRGCRRAPRTPLLLSEGRRTGVIKKPPGDSSASSQPWAASRWEGGQAGPAPDFLPISEVIEAWSSRLPSCDPVGAQLPSPRLHLGYWSLSVKTLKNVSFSTVRPWCCHNNQPFQPSERRASS